MTRAKKEEEGKEEGKGRCQYTLYTSALSIPTVHGYVELTNDDEVTVYCNTIITGSIPRSQSLLDLSGCQESQAIGQVTVQCAMCNVKCPMGHVTCPGRL